MNFESFLKRPEFRSWSVLFEQAIAQRTCPKRHGDLASWLATLADLPDVKPSVIDLQADTIVVGQGSDMSAAQTEQLNQALFALCPWRKGPYRLFDVFIDTEWRSDWKWQRLAPHISDLAGRSVLDVGCGTGYHCWRMLGAGAKYVLGIDPSMRFLMQYEAIQKYAQHSQFDMLPLGIEDMPQNLPHFDSVFSMGVLYHRRNPINHLYELKNLLQPGGELVLETLIIDDVEGGTLTPDSRYAQMRNVWSVMTVVKIIALLEEAGFSKVACVDQNVTSLDEQRRTPWMKFHSLKEFLDPADHSKTIEGYPAPKRGLFIAQNS